MFDIFEQPWTFLLVGLILLIFIWVYRSVAIDKRKWWQFLIPVIPVAAGFGLDYLVQTDSEQIKELLASASRAVEREDAESLGDLISEDYQDSFHRSKRILMSHCKSRLSEPLIKKSIARIIAMEINSPKAEVIFTARLVFDENSLISQSYVNIMLFKLRMELTKNAQKGWLISNTEIREINHQPASWKNIR